MLSQPKYIKDILRYIFLLFENYQLFQNLIYVDGVSVVKIDFVIDSKAGNYKQLQVKLLLCETLYHFVIFLLFGRIFCFRLCKM